MKCFVLIDLKVGKLTHQDIGQMDFYVRYVEKEEKLDGGNPTIHVVLIIFSRSQLLGNNS